MYIVSVDLRVKKDKIHEFLRFTIDNASLTILRVSTASASCVTWNDTAHLDGLGTTGRWPDVGG